jgi:RNA polymerase sigma-70 factor, ECF subfamily
MAQVRLLVRRRDWLRAHLRIISIRRPLARWRASLVPLLAMGRGGELSGSAPHLTGAQASARQARFEQWFAQYRLPLLDYLYGMTRDREWAADLVQETFLNAYTAADAPTAIANPRAWLYRIATNTALTALQRRKRFTWLPLTAAESSPGAGSSDRWARPELPDFSGQDIAADVAVRDAVWKTLAELPPRWRSVLLLQATAGFEVREIATQLGLSAANVRKILFRAKERFRTLHVQSEAAGHPGPKTGGPQ